MPIVFNFRTFRNSESNSSKNINYLKNYNKKPLIFDIPGSKKGESRYEFAYFEPSNRGDAYVGRGVVGIKLADYDHDTTRDVSLEELKELFPIRHTRMLEKLYTQYSSEEDYDEKEELLWALIKYIFRRSGFKIIY